MAVPPPSSAADMLADRKTTLRTELRARRAAFVAAMDAPARAAALSAIAAHLAPLISRRGIGEGTAIAGYVALGDEVDVLQPLSSAFHRGHPVALPHLTPGDRAMLFSRWHPDTEMTPGQLGIPQAMAPEPIEPAVLLVPLLGFDRAGTRLGQGGGYYDRWFAAHPHAMRIGIAWSVQEVSALPREAWDMPLHAVATEKEWIAFR
jgi:5-formyltetrahydrofolate cyclo-ligase